MDFGWARWRRLVATNEHGDFSRSGILALYDGAHHTRLTFSKHAVCSDMYVGWNQDSYEGFLGESTGSTTTMPKLYDVEVTQEELEALTEADDLCRQIKDVLHDKTGAPRHRNPIWTLMLTDLLVTWLENLKGKNEKQTRDYQTKALTVLRDGVIHGLAELRAAASKNVH
jgi:hypothetical protein